MPSNGQPLMPILLYYPTISIPDSTWLRQAVLFFDRIASIAPRVLWDPDARELSVPLTPELRFLWNEAVYEPLDPEAFVGERGRLSLGRQPTLPAPEPRWDRAFRLKQDLEAAIDRRGFVAGPDAAFVKVHRGKLHPTMLDSLTARGLVKEHVPGGAEADGEWLRVERRTALLYMSLLAEALCDVHRMSMVPGTDLPEYNELLYDPRPDDQGFPCVETHFHSALPVPRADVSFETLLNFRRERGDELQRYWQEIDNLQTALRTAQTRRDLTDAMRHFQQAQHRGVADLTAALADARVSVRWGSLKTLVATSTSATLVGAGMVLANVAGKIQDLPFEAQAVGALVVGAVAVKSYRVDKAAEARARERQSAFAYVYHGEEQGVLSR
jgi:hypothetical protein